MICLVIEQNRLKRGRFSMKDTCLVTNCASLESKRGVCSKHYRGMKALVDEGGATWEQFAAKGIVKQPGQAEVRNELLHILGNGSEIRTTKNQSGNKLAQSSSNMEEKTPARRIDPETGICLECHHRLCRCNERAERMQSGIKPGSNGNHSVSSVFKIDTSGPYVGLKSNRLFTKYVDSGEQLGKSGALSSKGVLITVNSVTFACEQCNQHFGSCRCEAVEDSQQLST
jgi:hypothetical protein